MPESAFVEKGLEGVRGMVRRSLHKEIDWHSAREKLAEYRHKNPDALPEDAAKKVFERHVAPHLFFAGGARSTPVTKPGVQSEVTPEVVDFALRALSQAHFGGEDFVSLLRHNPHLGDARDIVKETAAIPRVQVTDDEIAKDFYASQTARDIAVTRKIPTDRVHSFGCTHKAMFLVSALKAIGIKSAFVRTFQDYYHMLSSTSRVAPRMSPHSIVMFEVRGKKYLADPWYSKEVTRVTAKMGKRIAQMRKSKEWIEGEDQWGLGITSYGKFFKGLNQQDVGRLIEREKEEQPPHAIGKHSKKS